MQVLARMCVGLVSGFLTYAGVFWDHPRTKPIRHRVKAANERLRILHLGDILQLHAVHEMKIMNSPNPPMNAKSQEPTAKHFLNKNRSTHIC